MTKLRMLKYLIIILVIYFFVNIPQWSIYAQAQTEEMTYGYLIAVGQFTDVRSGTEVRIMTDDGKKIIVSVYSPDKIVINDELVDAENVAQYFSQDYQTNKQMILYQLDSDQRITEIQTLSESSTPDRLSKDRVLTNVFYDEAQSLLDDKYVINSTKTKIFYAAGDESCYMSDFKLVSGIPYDVELYDVDENNEVEAVVITSIINNIEQPNVGVVQHIQNNTGSAGAVDYEITVLSNNKAIILKMQNEDLENAINIGDVIKYNLNDQGILQNINFLLKSDEILNQDKNCYDEEDSNEHYLFGTISEVSAQEIKMTVDHQVYVIGTDTIEPYKVDTGKKIVSYSGIGDFNINDKFFVRYYGNRVKEVIDYGEIANNQKYGLLLTAQVSYGLRQDVLLRILDTNGDFHEYTASSRILLNGVLVDDFDKWMEIVHNWSFTDKNPIYQLVTYDLDNFGEVKNIHVALKEQDQNEFSLDELLTNVYYDSSNRTIDNQYKMTSNTKIFSDFAPYDSDEHDVAAGILLREGLPYTVELYDINESNEIGAINIRSPIKTTGWLGDLFAISKIKTITQESETPCYQFILEDLYEGDMYLWETSDNDIRNSFKAGDIIKCSWSNYKITSISLFFNAFNQGNYIDEFDNRNTEDVNERFIFGTITNTDPDYIELAANNVPIRISTTLKEKNIYQLNSKENELRSISQGDLLPGHKAVIVQYANNQMGIIQYEDFEEKYNYGYLLYFTPMGYRPDNDRNYNVTILNAEGKIASYKCNQEFGMLDGEGGIWDYLTGNDYFHEKQQISSQLITYRLNNFGEFQSFNTAGQGQTTGAFIKNAVLDGVTYNSETKTFGQYKITPATKVFYVAGQNRAEYSSGLIMVGGTIYNAEIYGANSSMGVQAVVISSVTGSAAYNDINIEKLSVTNEQGIPVTAIDQTAKTLLFSLDIKNNVSSDKVIRIAVCKVDKNNKMNNIAYKTETVRADTKENIGINLLTGDIKEGDTVRLTIWDENMRPIMQKSILK